MYSTNNSNSGQSYIYCKNDCGVRITFSDNAISKNGRKIPLQENGQPHSCPKSYFNIRRQALKENANNPVKEIENIEHYTAIDSQPRCENSSQEQEQYSSSPNHKITLEQPNYIDTIDPAIAEILSSSAKILSLLQEVHRHILREGTEKYG
jgi:hypothetical protein